MVQSALRGNKNTNEAICLRVGSYIKTPRSYLFKTLLLWKLVTVHQGQLTEDSLLLTRSLAFTLVERTGTSPSLGVMISPLGRGFLIPESVATSWKGVAILSKEWLDSISRASLLVGVAVAPTAKRVASKEERKILACILKIKEVEDGNELKKWMSKLLIDCQRSW